MNVSSALTRFSGGMFPLWAQCEQVLQAQCNTDKQLSITDPRTAQVREVKCFSSKYFFLKIISFCIKALLISFPIVMYCIMSLITVTGKPCLLWSHSTEVSAESARSPTGLTELLHEPRGVLMLRAGMQQGPQDGAD